MPALGGEEHVEQFLEHAKNSPHIDPNTLKTTTRRTGGAGMRSEIATMFYL